MTPTAVFGVRMFLGGVLTTGYCIAALLFLNFWRRSHDRLFAIFAAAFALLAVQSVSFAGTEIIGSVRGVLLWPYVIRLAAFAVILWAIIDKNRVRS